MIIIWLTALLASYRYKGLHHRVRGRHRAGGAHRIQAVRFTRPRLGFATVFLVNVM